MKIEVGAAIPERGYLKSYIEFASQGTMAPPEFHLACGLAQMAALLGNKVVFQLGRHSYPAAIWIVLLGKAGAKKSSAIALATRLLDAATESKLRLPEESSREALLNLLADKPEGYIAWSEFLGFLKKAKLEYMSGIKEGLCEVFDSPLQMSRQLRSGSTTIRRPAVTVLGGAVTDAMGEWVKRGDLEGGFLSRFLFVPQTSKVEYVGLSPQSYDPREDDLIAGLSRAKRMIPTMASGPEVVVIQDEARKVWEGYDRPMTEKDVPLEFSGFANRLGLYALKLSLCYALAEGRLSPTADDMWNAVTFVEYARIQTEELVADAFVSTIDSSEIRRLRELLRVMTNGHPDGWVRRAELLRRAKLTAWKFDRIAETLLQSGDWEETLQKHESGGRPARLYRVYSDSGVKE